MKKLITTFSILLAMASSAQEPWSLERCMAYAAEHASSVVQAQWDVASATATRNEALGNFFSIYFRASRFSIQLGSKYRSGN